MSSESISNWAVLSIFLIGGTIGLMIGAILGEQSSYRHWRAEIVKRGYAEYRCDSITGKIHWVWKERRSKDE